MTPTVDQVRAEILANPVKYAPEIGRIVPKGRELGVIPLQPKSGQIALEEKLAEQRAAGKPERAIILKARQVGMSTWIQFRMILASVLKAHTNAMTVLHEDDAVRKLFRMADRYQRNLPPEIRPEIRSHKTNDYMHFAQKGDVTDLWPDSMFELSTAGNPEGGRAGTYHYAHLSEYAFYPDAEAKYTAIMQAIGDHADTFIVIESTANGHNHFKELWESAFDGDSDFVPIFWPWWKEEDYVRPFNGERERAEFRPGDTDQFPYAEEEGELLDPGPVDVLTGENVPLTLEQLNWRRWAIINKVGGKLAKFHQEYPTTPEQAFLSTGAKVFEPILVSRVIAQTEQTDPRYGDGGPIRGALEAGRTELIAGQHGKVEAPFDPEFKPSRLLLPGEEAMWRFWLPFEDGKLTIEEDGSYIVGGDVSEGLPESGEGDPAYQALVIIDHRTGLQVAEYRSRVDPMLFAEHAVLTAMLFNNAWLAIESTGPGLAVNRKIWHDFHYVRTYRRREHKKDAERTKHELGWSTDRGTKPMLIAGGEELLREDSHGIRSRRLANEMRTYVRLDNGKMVPESGKFSDLLMAYLIAKQVAHELPILRSPALRDKQRKSRPPLTTRYGVYARR